MKTKNIKTYEQYTSLNESNDEYIKELRQKNMEKEELLEIYRVLCPVGWYEIDRLISAGKSWGVNHIDALEETIDEWEYMKKETDDFHQFIIYQSMITCARLGYNREFENYDWKDLDIDQDSLLTEDGIYENDYFDIDVSGDGSGEYETVYNVEELIAAFDKILINRTQENADWDDGEDD